MLTGSSLITQAMSYGQLTKSDSSGNSITTSPQKVAFRKAELLILNPVDLRSSICKLLHVQNDNKNENPLTDSASVCFTSFSETGSESHLLTVKTIIHCETDDDDDVGVDVDVSDDVWPSIKSAKIVSAFFQSSC